MKTLVALVGMKYLGTESLIASLPQGQALALVRKLNNPHDPLAIEVWALDQHVGYVRASQNREIAMRMDRDPVFADGLKCGRSARLAVDGGKWPMIEIILIRLSPNVTEIDP
jgi:hypothetical protein